MITSPPAPAVGYLRRSTDKHEQYLAEEAVGDVPRIRRAFIAPG